MKAIIIAALLAGTAPAVAAEPLTLNDLPRILQKLRGCEETRTLFSNGTTCRIVAKDLWVSVDSDGALTLFRQRSYGDTFYARGNSVSDLLKDFAAKINNDRENGKAMLDAIAPLLPTQ